MEWINYAVSILSGLAVAIPLVVKLVEYVQRAVKEKNWNNLLNMTMDLMKSAEEKFDKGATKKEWVMAMIEASAGTINYDVDKQAVSELIDSLCDMSNAINAPKENQKGKV